MLLSRALADRGLAVCVLVSDLGMDVPASVDGVDVRARLPYRRARTLRSRLREVAAVRTAVRSVDTKVFVSRCAGYWVGLVGFWAKLSRRRFVYASAALSDFDPARGSDKRPNRLLFRLGVALADEIVVQTEEQAELCRRRFGKAPILIKSLCDPVELTEHDPEAFLWAGRAETVKQPLEYLELARALPNARFWIVARPSDDDASSVALWDEIEDAANTLPNLELLPPRPHAEFLKLTARAVAVVSTSSTEGMPNVFLEGWAYGIPAVAFAHDPDGIVERHGLGAFAQGNRDRLVDLARDLWDARTGPERRELGDRCRAYVRENHSPQSVSAEWARVVRHLDDDGFTRLRPQPTR
jgi:glycosyltransferase involved in cell wall biosynthesis